MKKKPYKIYSLILALGMLAVVMTSCGSGSQSDAKSAPQRETAVTNAASAKDSASGRAKTLTDNEAGGANTDTPRKLVRNADLSMEVQDVPSTVDGIKSKLDQLKAYVFSYSLNESQGSYYGSLVIKVPSENLDALLAELKNFGKIRNTNISSDDITDSYYDLEARLKAAEEKGRKLEEMLNKATKMEDILEISDRISENQEQIERYKGQRKLWDNQVALSSVNVNIYTESKYINPESDVKRLMSGSEFWNGLSKGLRNSYAFAVNGLAYLIILIANMLVPLVLIGLIILGIILLVKKSNKRKMAARAKAAAQAPPMNGQPSMQKQAPRQAQAPPQQLQQQPQAPQQPPMSNVPNNNQNNNTNNNTKG